MTMKTLLNNGVHLVRIDPSDGSLHFLQISGRMLAVPPRHPLYAAVLTEREPARVAELYRRVAQGSI
jgi:hypothetical protein